MLGNNEAADQDAQILRQQVRCVRIRASKRQAHAVPDLLAVAR